MKLRLENVSKRFNDKIVLNNANYTFNSNKIYCILGRNGVGKTTLFNIIKNSISYDGTININGSELTNGDISLVPAVPIVPDFLTGREFVSIFMNINNINNKDVDEYLDIIKISDNDRDLLMRDYSYGMKSKIQLLINIMSNSKILLLDEPLTSIDLVNAEEIKNILKRIKNDHIIIFSTHILDLATSMSDEIVILKNGELKRIDNNSKKDINKVILNSFQDDNYEE